MKTSLSFAVPALLAAFCIGQSASAQLSTPPATPEELEAKYTIAIENRTDGVLEALDLQDQTKRERVHDAVIAFYRALRARDAVIDLYFQSAGEDSSYTNPERGPVSESMTSPIREMFSGTLSAYLTPEQIETVKNRLTYNKVQVTYDAYIEILPSLKANEKERIMSLLKEAREEAYTGGSSQEKTAVFEAHKSQINEYLNSNGYDVAKATEEWEKGQSQTASAGK